MTAYYVLTQTVTDIGRYRREYQAKVMPFILKYGGEVVVSTTEAEPLQGVPAKGVVIMRFPSEQAVRDFVNDADYQSLKEVRLAVTTDADAVLAPEFQMPKR